MTSLITFDYHQSAVRGMTIDGEPWFVAADVAAILGYERQQEMTRNLDDDEKGVQILHSPGGDQQHLIISESGLYNAIFRSRREEARAFRRWVTGTVLPALRRTGGFAIAPGAGAGAGTGAGASAADAGTLRAGVSAVRLARDLFGVGIARAVWQQLGLPMPDGAADAIDDGLAAAVRSWVGGRNHFTYDELAAGIGLGSADPATRRRMGDILIALGWYLQKRRRGDLVRAMWHAPEPAAASTPAAEALS